MIKGKRIKCPGCGYKSLQERPVSKHKCQQYCTSGDDFCSWEGKPYKKRYECP